MNILVIPLDDVSHPKADIRLLPFINYLSLNNKIIGLKRTPYFGTSNQFVRHLRFLVYFFKMIIYGWRKRNEIDLVLCEYTYFAIIGIFLGLLIKKPLIWDNGDGNLSTHCKLLKTTRLYRSFLEVLESLIGNYAKLIVVPSESDKELYKKQKKSFYNKITVIPSGVDIEKYEQRRESSDIKKELGLNSTVIFFSGNMDYAPNREALNWINTELFNNLCILDNFQIVVTGPGLVDRKMYCNINYVGYVDNYIDYLHAADICIVPYLLNTGISTKLLDYMASSKTIIILDCVAKLVPELKDNVNVLIARNRAEFIEKTIYAIKNVKVRKMLSANIYKVAKNYYNLRILSLQWQKVFEKAVVK